MIRAIDVTVREKGERAAARHALRGTSTRILLRPIERDLRDRRAGELDRDGVLQHALRQLRERAIPDVIAYADNILVTWTDFVLELGDGDPLISSPRGEVSWSTLLESQRNHVEFHLGQL